ncbi:hypothetical protein Q5424_00280 [Conexibacter sp. JD483]|uniref:hypothetical protein n=1 Tax=unclassified Conexibacter TaxID=2627773 RepID=UPI0027161898|nr:MULTISPECIES: hypothetical protein [unclassified Conexibacter]MDO8184199.1 hypothetical protein [Conexibacter sp. CPCC 205706]MDO8197191.1 hypothetical protein [Conexibacter sp. CPCC 205762]MDR9367494.1 hypothetical protein [Conexibacter sp. JD483]
MGEEEMDRKRHNYSERGSGCLGSWPLDRFGMVAVVVLMFVVVMGALNARPPSADAALRIRSFGGAATSADGRRLTQAGAHPDVTTTIEFETRQTEIFPGFETPQATESAKSILIDLPPGLVGAPALFDQCSEEQLTGGVQAISTICPVGSQVGVLTPSGIYGSMGAFPLYNMEPPTGRPGMFAANIIGAVVKIIPGVRADGGYRIAADVGDTSQGLNLSAVTVTLWGVPADPSHDAERTGTLPPQSARVPLMTNPTRCTGAAVVTRMRADSWETPGVFDTASFDRDFDGEPTIVTGCDKLAFDPLMTAQPSARKSRAPTGLDVTLEVPQSQNPDGFATAHLKSAELTLPDGMRVNPAQAGGLGACTSDEIALGSDNDSTCPENSKIGSISLHTPLIEDTLTGDVFLAKQRDNKFGSLIALYIVARGPGLLVKLPGNVTLDPVTGRVHVLFDDNPEIPFDTLKVSLNTGPRAPLSLPKTCGTATTTAVLTPWSGTAPVTLTSSFQVSYDGNGAPCPAEPFAPTFNAGMANPVGGADSVFTLGVARTDQDAELGGVSVNMPRGLLARIASVSLCSDGQAAAGTCGDDSKIGNVTTAAGAGSNPFSLPGRVYITGPYKGAPFGLSIVVPAVAGPFDLGTVVVRAAIFVDRTTAELRIVSDPLPSILEGIPLQIRLVEVKVDRPGFTFNPTNCSASRVGGQISSLQGAIANVASRFQVGNCSALPFTPKMTLKVGAKGKLTAGRRTPLDVTIQMSRAQANQRSVQVTLPLAINARLDVVNKRRACTLEQFRADRCPMSVGNASVVTPLLRDPLKGPAYFVYTPARRLPDLVIRLRGQVDFDLVGKVTLDGLKLRTTFDTVPDVPFSKFRLTLASGDRNGPVGLTRNACLPATRRALKADVAFIAQNGKRLSQSKTISVSGCGKATARGRSRRSSRSRRAAKK